MFYYKNKVCGKGFLTREEGKFCSHKCYSKNKIGKSRSIEWTKKISKILKQKAKREGLWQKNLWQKGDKHHNWKGGVTSENLKARKTRKYKEWRQAVFERDNYTCQDCSVRSGNGRKIVLNAHHIKSFAEFPELRYVISNGVTLCKDCH